MKVLCSITLHVILLSVLNYVDFFNRIEDEEDNGEALDEAELSAQHLLIRSGDEKIELAMNLTKKYIVQYTLSLTVTHISVLTYIQSFLFFLTQQLGEEARVQTIGLQQPVKVKRRDRGSRWRHSRSQQRRRSRRGNLPHTLPQYVHHRQTFISLPLFQKQADIAEEGPPPKKVALMPNTFLASKPHSTAQAGKSLSALESLMREEESRKKGRHTLLFRLTMHGLFAILKFSR